MEISIGDHVSFHSKVGEVSGMVGSIGLSTIVVNAFIPAWDMEASCLVRPESCKKLEVFSGTDQPETCPKCGSRTAFNETNGVQYHTCFNCRSNYVVE